MQRELIKNMERRREFYQRMLDFISKEHYKIVKDSVQHFMLMPNISKTSETVFCQSLLYYTAPEYKEHVYKKCYRFLCKTYGGKINL